MILLVKLYAQFQPSKAFEFTAVVDAYRKAPVSTVANDSVPFRPSFGCSTSRAPINAPGTPTAAMMSESRYVKYVEPSPKSRPRVAWM